MGADTRGAHNAEATAGWGEGEAADKREGETKGPEGEVMGRGRRMGGGGRCERATDRGQREWGDTGHRADKGEMGGHDREQSAESRGNGGEMVTMIR